MDNYESIPKLSNHSEIFHKFDKYNLYSIFIVRCDFTIVLINYFFMNQIT